MATAKIDLQTILDDQGLQSLNTELAKGEQAVKSMKAELKELEKAGQGASDAAVRLQAAIQNQKQANTQLNTALKENVKELKNATKESGGFSDTLKGSLKSSLDSSEIGLGLVAGAAAGLAATLATEVVGAVKDAVVAIAELGAQQEQAAARLGQVQSVIAQGFSGSEIYALFDATARDLEISTEQASKFSIQLMNAGISAQNASAMIGLCSDASYALGGNADQMQTFVDTFVSIAQRGEITTRQLKALQEQGVDLDKAFESLGMNGADAMQAVEDGTLDAETAINTLVQYMDDEYGGATARAKDNTLSAWGDVEGNLTAIMGSIGESIYSAFNQSGIIQALVDITQSLLDLVQGEGIGVFNIFGSVAQAALNLIGDALDIIVTSIKIVILIAKEMADAFRSIGAQIADYLAPILLPLKQIWDIVSGLIRMLGKEIKGAVTISYTETFGGVRSNIGGEIDSSQNNIRTQQKATKSNDGKTAKSGRESSTSGRESSTSSKTKKTSQKKELTELEQFAEEYKAVFDTIPKLSSLFGDKKDQAAMESAKQTILSQLSDVKTQGDALLSSDSYTDSDELNGIAKLLGQDPAMLKEEMALRQMTLQEFFDWYIAKQQEVVTASQQLEGAQVKWENLANKLQGSVSSSMTSAFEDIITGSESVSSAMGSMVTSMLSNISKLVAQYLTLVTTFMMFGSNGKTASDSALRAMGLVKAAGGGYISGAGSSTSDSIPALLSNGEYVVNAAAVNKIGRGNLDAINSGRMPESIQGVAANVGGNVTLQVSTIDSSGFRGFLQNGGLDTIRQALYDSGREFTTTANIW